MTNLPRLDSDQIAANLQELGDAWADRHAAAEVLEAAEKSLLADLVLQFRSDAKTRTEAEDRARASRTFRDHVAQAVEARRLANRARVAFDVEKARIELIRSNLATDREVMKLR